MLDNNLIKIDQEVMTVDSMRSIAEMQGQMILARKFPRQHSQYMPRILEACKRKLIAESAEYAYRRGSKVVSGPSIRLAEVIAQNYGNLDFGIRELSQDKESSLVQSYCYDLETNVRSQKVFNVPHVRYTRDYGIKKLVDPRDIYEVVANNGARRLRQCILALVPQDITSQAQAQCNKTQIGGENANIKDMIVIMVQSFKNLDVTPEMLEKYLGHNLDATINAEIVSLAKIRNSLRDGMAKRQDFFKVAGGGETDSVAAAKEALKNDKGAPQIRPKKVKPNKTESPTAEDLVVKIEEKKAEPAPAPKDATSGPPGDMGWIQRDYLNDHAPTSIKDQVKKNLGKPTAST